MIQFLRTRIGLAVGVGLAVAALPTAALADHAWGCYHWARSSNPLQLNVGDNVTSTWDGHLDVALTDWNQSVVLDLTEVAGGTPPKSCKGTTGRVEVCNSNYHNTGWLGIAQIWVNGCHIGKAVAKMNDYYFNQAQYNTPAWRQLVMCQEVAHDFGLDHQDEVFNNPNLGTCMDYTDDPDGGPGGASNNDPSNEHPNQHDYEELEIIYAHPDAGELPAPGVGPVSPGDLNSPAEWGRLVRTLAGGRVQDFERDLGNGQKLVTRVIWADPEPRGE
jgi:hypothetical protein